MAAANPQHHPTRLFLAILASLVCALLAAPIYAQDDQPKAPPERPNAPAPEADPDPEDPTPDPEAQPDPEPDPSPDTLIPETPEEALTAAKDAYISDDYEAVLRFLVPVAESTDIDNLPSVLQADVYRLLGLAYVSLDSPQKDKARAVFKKLLEIQSDFSFTEGLVRPEAIEELEEARRELGDIDGNGGQLPEITTVYIQKEVVERNFLMVFMPFGIGQFQNGDNGKGTFIAFLEGLSLVTNGVCILIIEQSLRGPNGLFTEENKQTAEGFRLAQFISAGFFFFMYAVGIADAWYNFQGTTVEIRKLDGPPDELTQGSESPILERRRMDSFALDAALFGAEGSGDAWVPSAPVASDERPVGRSLPMPITVIQMRWNF